MSKIAIIGSGLVGRGWAIVFARAGHQVMMYDESQQALDHCQTVIAERVADLVQYDLAKDADAICARLSSSTELAEVLKDAIYVQESIPETIPAKKAMFAKLDQLAAADTILASSSSGIPASAFTEELSGRHRCLIAHPVNPPYLIPLVELIPAPWTDESTVQQTYQLMSDVKQVPIMVKREIEGFILNRLQGALLGEAFRLVKEGYASVEDVDKTVRDGLGLRWSFMGPFETIDLNAPGGVVDYAERYNDMYFNMQPPLGSPCRWQGEVLDQVLKERRALLAEDDLNQKQGWRDQRLMALAAHKDKAE